MHPYNMSLHILVIRLSDTENIHNFINLLWEQMLSFMPIVKVKALFSQPFFFICFYFFLFFLK